MPEAQNIAYESNDALVSDLAPAPDMPVAGSLEHGDLIVDTLAECLTGRYFVVMDLATGTSRWSTTAVRELGLPGPIIENTASSWSEFVHPDDRAAWRAESARILGGERDRYFIQFRVRRAGGDYAICKCRGRRVDNPDGNPLFVGVITDRSQAEHSDPLTGLPNVERMADTIGRCAQEGTPTGLVGLKVGDLTTINATFGYECGDRVFSAFVRRLTAAVQGRAFLFRGRGPQIGLIAQGATKEDTEALTRLVIRLGEEPVEIDGRPHRVAIHAASLHYDKVEQQPFTVIEELGRCLRVAESRNKRALSAAQAAEKLEFSRVDRLTGLRSGQDFLAAARRLRKGDGTTRWCIASIDLGNLQIYNDWYGRDAGDLLISEVASILRDIELGGRAVAGYWGQDDFALMLELDEKALEAILDRVNNCVACHDASVGFKPSMGIYALVKDDPINVDTYAKALFANEGAKATQQNRVGYFRPADYQRDIDEHLLISGFQYALSQNQVTFAVQPQVDVETGRIVGAEALARWQREDGTCVSPADFIPALERNGFITTLDRHIWELAVRWQREVIDRGLAPVPVSVNVSRADIANIDIPTYLGKLLARYGIDPHLLRVEITETSFVESLDTVNDLVHKLLERGIRTHMDDFGSGMSSLGMLKEVDVHAIKFDREFLPRDPRDSEKGADILTSMLSMAKSIGLPVIVEGVESREQADFLAGCGPCTIQGFYYFRPMSPEELEKLLEKA